MAVRNTTVPFFPVPKTRLIYEILKAFMEKIDPNGNFEGIDSNEIFRQLVSRNVISEIYLPQYKRLLTALDEKGFLHHKRESLYSLMDDGHLAVLEWEDDFAFETDHIQIINEKAKININRQLKVFLSCGERDNEYLMANWLKEKMEENHNVDVYWWHKDPTNPSSHRPITTKIFEEIENCDFFIGILHRRYRLPTGLYTTSVPCEDEFRWACFNKKPRIGFRQKSINMEGMILADMEIRVIENSDQLIEYLQKSLDEYFDIDEN